ncbi:lamin tail domain-containing protein [Aeoliella sp.]|uniref:lamin tail domain-containing protein n=1 Tax=Aeoliella sp. TaxID=2795800 RepID=UPI003CCB9CDF
MHKPIVLIMAVALVTLSVSCPATAAPGDLVITELMYNPLDENAWEWLEVKNTTNAPIDLNGFWLDRIGDSEPPVGASPNISNTLVPPGSSGTIDTIIPAGGVAVLFDGFFGSMDPRTNSVQAFKDAWGLTTELAVPVSFFPGLSNSGPNTNMGLWENETVYRDSFVDDGDGGMVIGDFSMATASIDYDVTATEGWPSSSNGFSIEWSGNPSNGDGGQWATSVVDQRGAKTSVQSFVPADNVTLNNTGDIGNPGYVFGSTPTPNGKLIVTEVMYDPLSSEPNWEWIEVYNNTGAEVDLAGGVLDDGNSNVFTQSNIAAGTIPAGGVAVFYNDNLNLADIEAAWERQGADPDPGIDINFIAVSDMESYNNGAGSSTGGSILGEGGLDGYNDIVSIWASFGEYDAVSGVPSGDPTGLLGTLRYAEINGWPIPEAGSSYSLTDLTAAGANGLDADGSLWAAALLGDSHSYFAHPVSAGGSIEAHGGGDVGSPGVFIEVAPGLEGDFNDDGVVNIADYVVWRNNLGGDENTVLPAGSGNGNGTVDAADYALWKENFGAESGALAGVQNVSVPEPSALALAALLVIGGGFYLRRSAA